MPQGLALGSLFLLFNYNLDMTVGGMINKIADCTRMVVAFIVKRTVLGGCWLDNIAGAIIRTSNSMELKMN